MRPISFPKVSRNLLSVFVIGLMAVGVFAIWSRFDGKADIKVQRAEAVKEEDRKAIGNMQPGDPQDMKARIAKREEELQKKHEAERAHNSTESGGLSTATAGSPDASRGMPAGQPAGDNPAAHLPTDGRLARSGGTAGEPVTEYDRAKAAMVKGKGDANGSGSGNFGGIGVWEAGDIGSIKSAIVDGANAMAGALPESIRPAAKGAIASVAGGSGDSALIRQVVSAMRETPQNGGSARAAATTGSTAVDMNNSFVHQAAERPSDAPAPGGQPSQNNNSPIKPAASKYFLRRDSGITCTLLVDINTDSPGEVDCLVAEDVYDSVFNRYLLIPKGSHLHGVYDAAVMPGQSFILMAFQELSYPSGATVDLGAMRAGEVTGMTGIRAEVDNHFLKIFGSSFLVAGLAQAVSPSPSSQVTVNVGGGGSNNAAGQVLLEIAKQMAARNAAIKPTLSRGWGSTISVLVSRHLVLPPTNWKRG